MAVGRATSAGCEGAAGGRYRSHVWQEATRLRGVSPRKPSRPMKNRLKTGSKWLEGVDFGPNKRYESRGIGKLRSPEIVRSNKAALAAAPDGLNRRGPRLTSCFSFKIDGLLLDFGIILIFLCHFLTLFGRFRGSMHHAGSNIHPPGWKPRTAQGREARSILIREEKDPS